MDEDERLGLLQTVPEVIHAHSMFGRLMQFSAAYLSPYFARGQAQMQGEEGPYWGHNAIVRVAAFAASCGLPMLSGKPPAGGHILSHDYVEAALLSRAGWKVEVDPYLTRLLRRRAGEPDRIRQARPALVPGQSAAPAPAGRARAQVVEPLHVRAGHHGLCGLPAMADAAGREHHRGGVPSRYWWRDDETGIWVLAAAVAVVLLVPKFLIFVRSTIGARNSGFGGTIRAGLSVLVEIFVSTLLAPIMLCFQSRPWPRSCSGSMAAGRRPTATRAG